MAEYRKEFPSAFECVGPARRAVVDFARQWFSGEDLSDIEYAVGEALSNSAEHGHKTGTAIDVLCRCDGRDLIIEVKDSGAGFPRWNASDYVRPMSHAARGYGTFIMRELMDEMEYSEQGTRLRLSKRVASAASDAGERRRA
ncbi:MAG TPA: ATP-binding protein [Candidatus Rubrimentiphilum sp.]|nr:ATP-binding protein [Candidatus Rubrimentiphilum sp.]